MCGRAGGRRRTEEDGRSGAALKTKTPHANVGKNIEITPVLRLPTSIGSHDPVSLQGCKLRTWKSVCHGKNDHMTYAG